MGKFSALAFSQVPGCSLAITEISRQARKTGSSSEIFEQNRVRKTGGGRKPSIDIIENIDETFLKVIDDYVAGDPMNGNIRWTNLSQKLIAKKMKTEDVDVSVTVVKKLLRKHGFVKRKASKTKAIGSSSHRNQQFENIARLKTEYGESGNPVLSVDTKKKSS